MLDVKFVDLFSGIGGIRMGLERAGLRCVFSCDIDKPCREVYEKNFLESPVGDIRKIKVEDIPDCHILTAGFPCQPFSISGHKKGFEDTRGTLFFEILRILQYKRPDVVLLENVKHLIHHDNGQTLKIIIQSLQALNYRASIKVLNAINFGSAQNRERLIIIAHQRKYFNFYQLDRNQGYSIIENILEKKAEFEFLEPHEYTLLNDFKTQSSGLIFAGYRNKKIRNKGIRLDALHLSRTHKQPNRIYSAQGTHPTLPSQESSGRFWILHEDKVRKLTIRECYRLQGFPDTFKLHANKSQCYLQIGNSVYMPMIEKIGLEIINQFYIHDKEEFESPIYENLALPLRFSPK